MIFVDSADVNEIAAALAIPAVTGVTTNPALLANAAGADSMSVDEYLTQAELLCDLPAKLAIPTFRHLAIQVVGSRGDWQTQLDHFMERTREWPGQLWIKLPPTVAGLSLAREVASLEARSLVTAVFTVAQAAAAIEAGADGVALYMSRMIASGEDSFDAITDLVLSRGGFLLAASVGDERMLVRALAAGAHVTIAPRMVNRLLASDLTDSAMRGFDEAIEGAK